MTEMQKVLVSAHRANIGRYQKLLKTYLTTVEREFIERRLGEEEKSLMEIAQIAARIDCLNATWMNPSTLHE